MAAAAREASATANKANVRPMGHLHPFERARPAPDLARDFLAVRGGQGVNPSALSLSICETMARAGPERASDTARASACALCPLTRSINAGRGVRCADSVKRAQIADGVRGPRADASESIRRAVRAAPCLSLHVKCLAGGLAFCVAAQGHAAWRRLRERYTKRPASPASPG